MNTSTTATAGAATTTARWKFPKNRVLAGAGTDTGNIHNNNTGSSTSNSTSTSTSTSAAAATPPARPSRLRTKRYSECVSCQLRVSHQRQRGMKTMWWWWWWASVIFVMMQILIVISYLSSGCSYHHGELWSWWRNWWWTLPQSCNDVSDQDIPPLSLLPEVITTRSSSSSHNHLSRLDLSTILQETICPKESSLLNLHYHPIPGQDNEDAAIQLQIRQWTIRLLYAVIYEQQQHTTSHHHDNDHHHDKYLILSLSPNGLGANLRLGLVPILQLGMVLNRTVLVINDFLSGRDDHDHDDNDNQKSDFIKPPIPKALLQPWPLASCRDPTTNDSYTNHETSNHHSTNLRRNDYQCFFRPVSSGIMTPEIFRRHRRYDPTNLHHPIVHSNQTRDDHHNDHEYDYYYSLPRQEVRYLFRHGQFRRPELHDISILIVPVNFRPQRQPTNLPRILHQRARALVEQQQQLYLLSPLLQKSHFHSVAPSILHQAVDAILTMDFNHNNSNSHSTTNDDFNYYGANSLIYHSFLLYTLRPNPYVQQQLDTIVQSNIIPNHVDLDIVNDSNSNIVIGLPIRASDKCRSGESECLPTFRDYLDAAHDRYTTLRLPQNDSRHNRPIRVIVTTESRPIRDEMQDYQQQQQQLQHPLSQLPIDRSYHYQFITNPLDVTQDTGYFEDRPRTKHQYPNQTMFMGDTTANDIMISTLSSLQLQLYATHLTVGNCCSNFHLILKDLLHIGCGVAPARDHHHQFQCLQNHPNPQYRICCSWDKSVTCQNKRRQANE